MDRYFYRRSFWRIAPFFGVWVGLVQALGGHGWRSALLSGLIGGVIFGLLMLLFVCRPHVMHVRAIVGRAPGPRDLDVHQLRGLTLRLPGQDAYDCVRRSLLALPKSTLASELPAAWWLQIEVRRGRWKYWPSSGTMLEAEVRHSEDGTLSAVALATHPTNVNSLADFGHALRTIEFATHVILKQVALRNADLNRPGIAGGSPS